MSITIAHHHHSRDLYNQVEGCTAQEPTELDEITPKAREALSGDTHKYGLPAKRSPGSNVEMTEPGLLTTTSK